MSPRVLFIAPQPFFQWRGSPIRVGFDVLALAQLGYQVDLLVLPIGESKATPGVRVIRVANPFRVTDIPIGPSGHKAIFDVLLFVKALALALRNRYAAIHAVEEAGTYAWLIAKLAGARVIFEKHSDPASHRGKWFRNLVLAGYRHAEIMAIRRADAVIATGESLCEQARRAAPAARIHHIFDIPSSLAEPAPARVAAIRAQLLEHPAETIVLYAGSFAAYQGIDLMFDSWIEVLAQQPLARLVIVGGDQREIAHRQDWLGRRRIARSVTFVGKVPPDQLPNFLAAADILLSPRSAGLNTPLKLLDYLKAGRAIVATDHPANRRILDDSVALLVEATAPAFAAAISRSIGDRAGRQRLGERGPLLVAETWTYQEFKRRLAVCYGEALGGLTEPPSLATLVDGRMP